MIEAAVIWQRIIPLFYVMLFRMYDIIPNRKAGYLFEYIEGDTGLNIFDCDIENCDIALLFKICLLSIDPK